MEEPIPALFVAAAPKGWWQLLPSWPAAEPQHTGQAQVLLFDSLMLKLVCLADDRCCCVNSQI